MSDLIDRQAAIDALCDEYCGGWQDCKYYPKCENLKAIQNLPSAKPKRIIHCKDCEWWTKQECSPQGRCALSGMYPTGGWFCGNAMRREVNNESN